MYCRGDYNMAIIVCHRKTNKKYILLGAGFGAYKSSRPSFLGGNIFPNEQEGTFKMVSVCDRFGNIKWFEYSKLKVIEVDGVRVSEYKILYEENETKHQGNTPQDIEMCPACGYKVPIDQMKCPSCGLTLVDNTYKELSDLAKRKRR